MPFLHLESLTERRSTTMPTHVFILGRRSLNESISVLNLCRELAEVRWARTRLVTCERTFRMRLNSISSKQSRGETLRLSRTRTRSTSFPIFYPLSFCLLPLVLRRPIEII